VGKVTRTHRCTKMHEAPLRLRRRRTGYLPVKCNSFYYWQPKGPGLFCWLASVVVVCRLSLFVTLPVDGSAGRRSRGRSGCRHCTAGQYGYVPFGRHLVYNVTHALNLNDVDVQHYWWFVANRLLNETECRLSYMDYHSVFCNQDDTIRFFSQHSMFFFG